MAVLGSSRRRRCRRRYRRQQATYVKAWYPTFYSRFKNFWGNHVIDFKLSLIRKNTRCMLGVHTILLLLGRINEKLIIYNVKKILRSRFLLTRENYSSIILIILLTWFDITCAFCNISANNKCNRTRSKWRSLRSNTPPFWYLAADRLGVLAEIII